MASSVRRAARPFTSRRVGVPEWAREEGRHLLEVLALAGFALVQPVLDPLGRSPETFVARQVGSHGIVVFGLAVALGPPLLLWLLAAAFRAAGPGPRTVAQGTVVGCLTTVATLQFLVHTTEWPLRFVVVPAAGASLLGVVARSRLGWFRAWLRYASPAPIVFAALFLFVSPVSALVIRGSSGAGASGDAAPTSVVLVVFDEFSLTSMLDGSGAVDRELFPNLAAFADGATWYRNTTTASALTAESVPSILDGKLPREGDSRAAIAGADSLFTLLRDSHVVNAHEWVTSLCPPDVCASATRSPAAKSDFARLAFDVWWGATWPRGVSETGDLTAESLLASRSREEIVEDFFGSIAVHARPSLDVVHVALPHAEWTLLPSGQEYTAPDLADSLVVARFPSQERADANRLRYLLQAQYTDALVGRLVARLEEMGRYDDSLVVITADHGVVFEPQHSQRELSEDTQADVGWVPLLVKAPRQDAGVVDDGNVLLVDVLPTIASELGVTIRWAIDGVPAGTRPGDEKPVVDNFLTRLPGVEGGYAHLEPSVFAEVLAAGPSGTGTGPLRVWRSGRLGNLVGRPVSELPSGPPADVEITLDVPRSFADFDPSAAELELYVGGRVTPAGSFDIALVVDGVVAGWSETWVASDRPDEFGAVLAAPLLGDGRHEVDAYLVETTGADTVLRPVAVSP